MISAEVVFKCRCCGHIFTETSIAHDTKGLSSLIARHEDCRCTRKTQTGGDDTFNVVGFGDAIGYVTDTFETSW